MCGIVGYVGEQSALDVVIEGLRRLEYRGYDSAGRRAARPTACWSTEQAGRQARQPRDGARASTRCRRRRTGIGHTRWATHGPPNDRNAHPHLDCTGAVAVIHNGIIENFARAARRARGSAATSSRSDTDTEVVAHLLEERVRDGDASTWPRRCAAVCRRLEGAFTLVVDARRRARRRRRRPPQLAARRRPRRRRELPRLRRRRVHRAHPRGAIELGQDQVVELRRDGVTVTDFDGDPGEVREYHVDWDAVGRREGRLRLLHAQGDRRAAAGRRRHPARPARRRRPAAPRRDAALRRGPARDRQDRHHRLRHGRTTPAWSPSTPSSTGPGSRARSSWPRSSATATRSSPASTLVVAISQSRRDDGHADGAAARPRAEGAGARDLQHQRLDDPARVRRGALHPRRPRGRGRVDQGVPHPDRRDATSSASTSRRCAARSTATRSRRSSTTCARCRPR